MRFNCALSARRQRFYWAWVQAGLTRFLQANENPGDGSNFALGLNPNRQAAKRRRSRPAAASRLHLRLLGGNRMAELPITDHGECLLPPRLDITMAHAARVYNC